MNRRGLEVWGMLRIVSPGLPGGEARLELRIGDQVSVPLPGLAAAGYRWRAEVASGADVVAVETSLGPVPQSPGQVTGQSAPESLGVTALAPGTAVVRLIQARPWEPIDKALRTVVIDVTVS